MRYASASSRSSASGSASRFRPGIPSHPDVPTVSAPHTASRTASPNRWSASLHALVCLFFLLIAGLGLAPAAFAQSGAISASPQTVVIPAGGSVGTTWIGWSVANGHDYYITVSCNGGGEGLFAASGGGTYTQDAPWITVGASCDFRLRAGSSSGPVLDVVTVTGVTPYGSISASPSTVIVPAGQPAGTTWIGWSAQHAEGFFVTVACNGGGEAVFASSGAGTYSQDAPWIAAGASCTFRLRAYSSGGPVLGETTVTGVAQTPVGSISASPTTVVIPAGQSSGTTYLGWSASNGDSFHVTVACNGGGEGLFASSGPGTWSQAAPWITVGSSCVFRLRAGTTSGPELGSVTVTGVAGATPPSGSISASPTTVLIPSGSSTGSSTVSWNTANLTQAVVLSSCAGGGQSVFATSGAGASSRVATFIPVGASCVFQLRADSTSGALLGSVTVTGQRQASVPLITAYRGGSNHLFYRHPPQGGAAGYPYGIALHYHEAGVRSTVQGQLQQMYANGQRSLRVFVHYLHAPGATITDTPAESSRKCRVEVKDIKNCPAGSEYFLPLQYQENLANYLADIRNAGFERVMVAIGPQWINDFYGCASPQIPTEIRSQLYAGSPFVNELFEESWGVAKETRAITVASGLSYLIDLGNEYIPPSNLTGCAKDIIEGTATTQGYLRFMWGRYVANYGAQDTVGFSVIVGNSWDADNRLARMPQFLSPLPAVYSLHSYTGSGDIYGGLRRAYQVTGNFGRRPWIIGETDSRSTAAADSLRRFILDTPQQSVLYVLQWPGFNCTTEAECLPLDFSAFTSRGF